MATVRIKFRAPSSGTREGALYFQVIHNRTVRQISTGYRLYEAEWGGGGAVPERAADQDRRAYLIAVNEGIRLGFARLERAVSNMGHTGMAYAADDVVNEYEKMTMAGGFVSFLRSRIGHLRRSNRRPAADKVRTAMNSLLRFVEKEDIPFERIDCDLMEEYEGWLRAGGACRNTVSFYMRTLRTVYNIAVRRGLTEQQSPFQNVYTGVDKTVKRAVPLGVLARICCLDLTAAPWLDFARDLFMLSFYLRGISFVDMCFLEKGDLKDGVLSYRRRKTGRLLQVRWEKPMQRIVDKYRAAGTPYLLPIIASAGGDKWGQYENALRRENRSLKAIGKMIGLDTPLTTHVARHSWATAARGQNIAVSVISEALGHNSVNTTKIYLATLDTSVADRANHRVLKALRDCAVSGRKWK